MRSFDRQEKSILVITFLMVNMFISLPFVWFNFSNQTELQQINDDGFSEYTVTNGFDDLPDSIKPAVTNLFSSENPIFPSDVDIEDVLTDRKNDYNTIFEPWRSQAAVHAIAYDEATGFLAVGGGYLYDNEIHIYRQNVETGKFDKVWDAGSNIIQSDIMCVDFGDTDLNDFLEVIVGSSDGHIYVFEQNHIYDPYTNTENMFELVWISESHFRVFALKVDDVDRDYRPDIVAGTWDGLFMYEYSNHSNYPFSEEHWITYDQVFAYPMDEKIYSLETGDTNYNGLPEIVVGTRSGIIYVFENDGLVTYLNGQPFPLISDNHYALRWTSENYTWTPIISMDIGELDEDPGSELAIVAQGQGLFLLDWDDARQTYTYQKIGKDYKEWETFGYWGLDYYVDRVISANNVTYHDPNNASLIVDEPINYVWNGGLGIFLPDADAYPYNTGMAGPPDGNYTTFDASSADIDNATAIVDFGLDEEGTGSANSAADIIIQFQSSVPADIADYFNFSISQNGGDFIQIDPNHFSRLSNRLLIDVDSELHSREWDWFRYAKISVFNNGSFVINSLELTNVYNLLTDALSVEIGPMRTSGMKFINDETELDKIIIGTVYGKYIVVGYDTSINEYRILWDSGEDDRYTMKTGVWDLVHINSQTDIPIFKTAPIESPYPLLPPPDDYNSWSIINWDPYGLNDGKKGIILGTRQARIDVRNNLGANDSDQDSHLEVLNNYIASHDWLYSSVAPFKFGGFLTPALAVGLYNPNIDPVGTFNNEPSGNIIFSFRIHSEEDFQPENTYNLITCDTTGELTTLVSNTRTTPKMTFYDYDGDGDQDMILSMGQIYLAKSEMEETGTLNFTLVPGYFDQINQEMNSYGWGQPDVYDINQDGVKDLILNYANSYGATIFINKGDNEVPEWYQDKTILTNYNPDTNIKLMNLTDARMIPVGEGYFPDYSYSLFGIEPNSDMHLIFYNNLTGRFQWTEPEYNAIDSYLVATYPLVSRMDFSLIGLEDEGIANLGFHVRESWNNDFDLKDWSLSIASADLDGDGKGELIVGDYDNNMYAFENLLNNTYKRMYQSPDLLHEENSTESPYLYEELEGISGEFTRRIWDHAEYLLADVDLDGDGLKEVLVATDLQIHIFEDADLFGGDQLDYINTIDLRQSSFNGAFAWDQLEDETITAISYGNDLDYNGKSELIVAAGPFLFVLNIEQDNYVHCLEDGYFVTNDIIEGRYALIGNPNGGTDFEFAVINAVTTGDTDEDGYRELIIGGILDKRYSHQDGFVYIYECQGGTFYSVWEAPQEVVQWNPVTTLTLDDQDYDSAQEIIIGHSQGFDVWEWIPGSDSDYMKTEYVTSNPNYPIIKPQNMLYPGLDYPYTVLVDRGRMDLTNGKGQYADYMFQVYSNGTDLYQQGPDDYWMTSIRSRIWWKFKFKSSPVWSNGYLVNPSSSYMNNLDSEIQPSVSVFDDGELYAAWVGVDNSGNGQLWAVKYQYGVGWGTPFAMSLLGTGIDRQMPKIFEYDDNTIGILYIKNNRLAYSLRPKDLSSGAVLSWLNFPDYTGLNIHSCAITKLETGEFILAFSAINDWISKPDFDIWTMTLDNNFNYSKATLHQATTSNVNELYPDIDYLRNPEGSVAIIYESEGVEFDKRLGMVGSTNKGFSWHKQKTVGVISDELHMIEIVNPNQITWEFDNPNLGRVSLTAPIVQSPTIVGLDGEGFSYSYMFSAAEIVGTYTVIKGDYPLCIPYYGTNLQSDWITNDLEGVIDLAVGDTDNDGRREIAVGWDSQVAVYELDSSTDGTGFMEYTQDWLSDPFKNEFTGITIYDTNGNGWEELGISTKRGNVYLMEYPNPTSEKIRMIQSEESWNKDIGIYAKTQNMLSYDYDNDSNDEMIFIDSLSGRLKLVSETGDEVWSKLYGGGYSKSLILADITNDSFPEILFAKENGYLYVVDLKTGDQLWNRSNTGGSGGGDIEVILVGDIDNSGMPEVLYCDNAGWLTILDYQGNFTAEYDLNDGVIHSVYSASLGYFMSTTNLSLAYGNSQGILRVINPLNGTILYESAQNIISNNPSYWSVPILHLDLDDDGLEELIIGDDCLRIVDPFDNAIIYNSTYYGEVQNNMFLANFDNDDDLEVLVETVDNGIFMEDIIARQTKWHYSPSSGNVKDMDIGHFQDDDLLDVALATEDGFVIAVDGLSGNMIWFNYTGDQYDGLECLFKSNSNKSYPTAWDNVGLIHQFDSYILNQTEPEPAFVERALDYSVKLNSNNVDIWSSDIKPDGVDEAIWLEDGHHIVVWDYLSRKIIWEKNFTDDVSFVRFGNIDNTTQYMEIVVVYANDIIEVYNIEDDTMLFEIKPEQYYKPKEVIVADFNSGYSGEELAILYEKSEGVDNGTIEWYDSLGKFLYRSEADFSTVGSKMIPVHYSSLSTFDVAVAGYFAYIDVFNGGDGKRSHHLYYAPYVYDFIAGDFNGDGYSEVVTSNSIDTVIAWDLIGGGFLLSLSFGTGNILQMKMGDLYLNDSKQELVVNVNQLGVAAYTDSASSTGDYIWIFNAPLIIGEKNSEFEIADHNNDGYQDLSFKNYNYWNVIDGHTSRLLWHYQSDTPIYDFTIGVFDERAEQIGMVYRENDSILFISYKPTDPLMSGQGAGIPEAIAGITPGQIAATLFTVPFLIAAIYVFLHRTRKIRR